MPGSEQLREEIKAVQEGLAATTLFVTHDQEEALTMWDRLVVMNGGRIEQVGTPSEVYENPATVFVADFLGVSNPEPAADVAGHEPAAAPCGWATSSCGRAAATSRPAAR